MSLSVRELTTGEVEGSGIFDELMRTVKSHIDEQLSTGNITQQNYATVYLGSLERVLQVSSDYLLKLEQVNQQVLLQQEQVLQAKKQNELLELQKIRATTDNAIAQYNLNNLLPEQLALAVEQRELVTQQKAQSVAQTNLVTEQKAQVTAQKNLTTKQESLVDAQILDAEDKVRSTPTTGLNLASYDKIVAEKDLIAARKQTEDAQTVGTLTDNNGVLTNTVGGVLGKQMELLYTQKEGFLRDAEQKAAKIQSDAFSVAHSIEPASHAPTSYGFGPVAASSVIAKLNAGINVT